MLATPSAPQQPVGERLRVGTAAGRRLPRRPPRTGRGHPAPPERPGSTPPRAEPSIFVSTTPVSSTASVNARACAMPFWPVVRVEDQERLVDLAAGLLDRALHLRRARPSAASWCAGVRPCPRSSTSDAARRRGRHGIERHRAGVGAALLRDDVRARPLRPDLELLARGRAERVARSQAHRVALVREGAASLPIVVVLPEPLTPTTEDHGRACPSARCDILVRAEHRGAPLDQQHTAGSLPGSYRIPHARHEVGGA